MLVHRDDSVQAAISQQRFDLLACFVHRTESFVKRVVLLEVMLSGGMQEASFPLFDSL